MQKHKNRFFSITPPFYRGLATFALAIALVIVTGVWLGSEGGRILSLQEEQDSLTARSVAVAAMQSIYSEIELAYRGTLMTGTGKALEQLRASRQRWQQALEKTRQAFVADTAGLQKLDALAQQSNTHFTSIEKSLLDFRGGGALIDVDNSANGKNPLGAQNNAYEEFNLKLRQQRDVVADSLEKQARWIRYISLAAALAALALIAAAAYTLYAAFDQVKMLKEKLARESIYDELTGLANRRYLHAWLQAQISSASRMGDSFHVLYLDLDGFDRINEQYGHDIGDAILVAAAQRLNTNTRGGDFVARQKDDEFVMIFSCDPDSREIGRFAARLIRSLGKPLVDGVPDGLLSASIGVANYPADGETANDLVEAARKAMRQAKRAGKACYAYRRETAPNNEPHVWEVSRF